MNLLKDTDSNWSRRSFSIKLGDDCKTYNEIMEKVLRADKSGARETEKAIEEMMNDELSLTYLTKMNTSDTSVGGCDVFNPYAAFCKNDDIIHPITSSDGGVCETGMGRVYSETYDAQQQVLYLKFGVPQYTNLQEFYSNSGDSDTATIMNTGRNSLGMTLGSIIGTTAKLTIFLPFYVLNGIYKLTNSIVFNRPVTKYYEFRESMWVYYKMVNSVVTTLAVNLGLIANGDETGTGGVREGSQNEQLKAAGAPEVFAEGCDIVRIMGKRARRLRQDVPVIGDRTEADWTRVGSSEDKSAEREGWYDIANQFIGSALGANDYVGFRIEKSTDSGESLSNSIGESSVAGSLNSMSQSVRDKKFAMANGNFEGGMITSVIGTLADIGKGVVSSLVGDAPVTMMTGNGFFSIPEVWQNSSFTKSYSFNFSLRTKAGDPISYMQDILIPLSMILAGSLPREIGRNMYTSPFVLQAFCKGMFGVSLGMVESISIKRGAAEYGWTFNNLPTVVDVSLQIKDLSPAVFMGMLNDNGSFISPLEAAAEIKNCFFEDTPLMDYLATLSGLGIAERTFKLDKIKKKITTLMALQRNQFFSAEYWSQNIGTGSFPRLVGYVTPWSAYPRD